MGIYILMFKISSSQHFCSSFATINKLVVDSKRSISKRILILKIENNKIKTRKSAYKRFKITGSGKVIRRKCGKQHLNEKKSRNRKNCLSSYKEVSESDLSNVLKCLPYKSR